MSATTYLVEYAKSNRSSCKGCKAKIEKEVLRCGTSYEMDEHPMVSWFHLECFKVPNKLESVDEMQGYSSLDDKAKKLVEEYIEDHGNKVGSQKWKKGGKGTSKKTPPDAKVQKVMEHLKSHYNMAQLKKFLSLNEQRVSGTKDELCERIADGMVHGTLPRCPKCSAAILKVENGIIKCPGHFDDVTFKRCSYKYNPDSEDIPEQGIPVRSEWKQHGTEKDDALKEAESIVLSEKPKPTPKPTKPTKKGKEVESEEDVAEETPESEEEKPKKRKAKTDAKKKAKKAKKDASDDEDDEDYQ